jgi:NAD(P)-dependent dehydrogenase (short-subunit alcohol dehydrogenase family)
MCKDPGTQAASSVWPNQPNNEREGFMAKTWFITGASSAFGRQLAAVRLERGDRVAAIVRKPDALHDLQRIIANG